MSSRAPRTGKLIDIDSSFEELNDADESFEEINLNTTKHNNVFSSPCAKYTQIDDDIGPYDDDSEAKLAVSFSIAQYESRWSRSSSVGGTVLNDPALKSDFDGDYRLWSRVAEQKKKFSSSTSLTNSLLSNILGQSASEKNSQYTLDHLLTSDHHKPLDRGSASAESLISQPPTNSNKMTSKYHTSDWTSTNSLPLTAQSGKSPRLGAYGETRRLMDGSSTQLIGGDHHDEEYDSDGFGGRLSANINSESSGTAKQLGCDWGLYKGILYSSLSSIFFSLSAVIVKYLKDIHPGQLAVCRFVGIFVLTIPLIVYHDLNPFGPPELRHLLILRGLAGATSLFLRFVAFHYLPIADASVIIFSIPIFVSIFAYIFLKEPCGLFQSLTIVIAMIGLMMTTKLPFLFGGDSSLMPSNTYYVYQSTPPVGTPNLASLHANWTSIANITNSTTQQALQQLIQPPQAQSRLDHFYGVAAGLSSLLFASSVFIFIRKAKGAHHAVIMFNFGWVAMIETTIITTALSGFSLPANPMEWYLIVVLSVFSFCGQILLTRSLQLEQAGPVSVVRATTDIALAFIWQIIIFHEMPDLWSIFGALLVSSCIVLTSLRKWVLSLPEHSRLKAKFHFITL